MPGDGRDGYLHPLASVEQHWRERARWCKTAGIEYWKVDWGIRGSTVDFRRMISSIAREEYSDLLVENGRGSAPINDYNTAWDEGETGAEGRYRDWGKVLEQALEILSFSDITRCYDVTVQMSAATTLDRVAELLLNARHDPGVQALINCEDELYLGAALGCAIGIMRSQFFLDDAGHGNQLAKPNKRMDEAVRAVRWHRIAPAFGAGIGETLCSEKRLTDRWFFQKGDTWLDCAFGKEFIQSAPAVVARNMELPAVKAKTEDFPYVVASLNPNGAMAITTLPRTCTEKGIYLPLAEVAVKVPQRTNMIGIFGEYESLVLQLSEPLGGKRILAQDLAGDEARDITDRVVTQEDKIVLPGALILEIGLSAATPGDFSGPGMVLALI